MTKAENELVEALEKSLGWIRWHRDNPKVINSNSYIFETKALELIAKARGESK